MTDLDLDLGPDLHDLMDRSLADVDVPTDRLQRGAVQRGRVVRRRRRAAAALTGVVAAAAVTAVVLPALGGSGTQSGGVAVEPTPTPGPTSTTAEVEPAPFVAHPGWWDMPVEEMKARLAPLLPAGVQITSYEKLNTDHAPGESDQWSGVFAGTLRQATDTGPGSIEIFLTELPRDPSARSELRAWHFGCDPRTSNFGDQKGVQCEVGDVRNGVPYERTVTHTADGVSYVEVRRWTKRGEVYAAVANSVERKWGPPASAEHAPMTLAELRAVVESTTWTDWTPAG